VVVKDGDIPDEHLYGRAGYLASLMFVQSHLGPSVVKPETIRKVKWSVTYLFVFFASSFFSTVYFSLFMLYCVF
jgi:hypothetical protein